MAHLFVQATLRQKRHAATGYDGDRARHAAITGLFGAIPVRAEERPVRRAGQQFTRDGWSNQLTARCVDNLARPAGCALNDQGWLQVGFHAKHELSVQWRVLRFGLRDLGFLATLSEGAGRGSWVGNSDAACRSSWRFNFITYFPRFSGCWFMMILPC